ncbi:response regulator transcription factor [Prosthecomicrobium pneumaticum]|uniref:FixJ family two-component response regulator n=1 Tax=Prosthecomicrobium pneumaticum TaxID=81895 RepID=A0A7W9CTR1_9HYPH|nr:response regulator [Prosthecomicrobium pneumaticum]MBB5751371.1 FixJ family two-component response regulator [Prosthecomicrobium pneumaticum]
MHEPTVYIVDDDAGYSASLAALFASVNLRTELFSHPQTFLEQRRISRPACAVLDMRLPGISGLDVLRQMRRSGWTMPVLFVSGHADVATAVRALHAGACDMLEKPVNDTLLLQLVQRWIRADADSYAGEMICRETRMKLDTLTEREKAILDCVLRGLPNKVAARELKLSVKAVEGHRINVLHKMGASSPVDLFRMVATCPKVGSSPLHCCSLRADPVLGPFGPGTDLFDRP